MAGKAVKSAVTKAVVEYQYPWKEKLAKYKDELSKGVWGYWHLGAWKPLGLSGRHRARLRKEVLLAGQYVPSSSSLSLIPLCFFYFHFQFLERFLHAFVTNECFQGLALRPGQERDEEQEERP